MRTRSFSNISILCLTFLLFACQKDDNLNQPADPQQGILSFSTNGQTLPAAIDINKQQVKFEVDHDIDLTRLVPEFEIPEGYSAYINGVPQVSGGSCVDFTEPVKYLLKSGNSEAATWEVSAVQLSCKILIDASHDGGVWWFPQSPATGFDPNKYHQGQAFANLLREKGFQVDELGRGAELTEKMFFGYYIIVRVNGIEKYTEKELQVYKKLVERGMNLLFFTDHKKYDPTDELADLLGIKFEGLANGIITRFTPHIITEDISSLDYIAGSVLTNLNQNRSIMVLGWLRSTDYADLNFNGIKDENEPVSSPVMGILNYPKSHIFFIGDTNGLLVMPQPFINNLIKWMGNCFTGGGVN